MYRKLRSSLLALLIVSVAAVSTGADMREVRVPPGWDLSATLCLFRNLPYFDQSAFPATEGKVFYRQQEESSADGLSFTNTYHFYRKTTGGEFLEITLVERHTLVAPRSGDENLALAGVQHKVADIEQKLGTVAALPDGAEVRSEMSQLLSFVLTHRQPLVASQAGELAKSLNYQPQGRVRSPEYLQPRVSYVPREDGSVDKIRVYGLDTLLGAQSGGVKGLAIDEDSVLEISVDDAGNVRVELPKAP